MTDKTSKTIRDLERLLRQEFGFSSRRSKAGATEAWKALTNIDLPQPDEQNTAAKCFIELPDLRRDKALELMRSALAEIEKSGGPAFVGAHLSLAIERLLEAVGEEKSRQSFASGT